MDTSFSEKNRPTNSVIAKPTNTTKKPKTAKQMEAFKKANDMKNERLRKWREENLRREARGEEPLVWATKAKARKDALKNKEKEDKLHSLFLKSLQIQKKQIEDDEEKARIDRLKIKIKPTNNNSTRKNKPIRKAEAEPDTDDSDDDFIEQPTNKEPVKLVNNIEDSDDDDVNLNVKHNVDAIRAEFTAETERGEREAQLAKYLLEQQKILQKQQPAPIAPQTPAPIAPQTPAPIAPQTPRRQPQEAYRTEPIDRVEIARRQQYATRDDFDDLKKEIINRIQQPQVKINGDSYNLITDTKIAKKPIEPPKYTTDINYVYNQQTLQKPVEQQKPLNSVRSITPIAEPEPEPAPYQSPTLSQERLRSMMGMRRRYEPVQQQSQHIKYTTNSALLNRMFFNHN
jgi:hypothetical protein